MNSAGPWAGAYRGVLVYRWSLILTLLGVALAFVGRGIGTAAVLGGSCLLLCAGLVAAIGVGVFAVGVPSWAQPAKTRSLMAAVATVVSGLLMLGSAGSVGGFSYRAYERAHAFELLALLCGAGAMVLFLWAWKDSAEVLADARAVTRCRHALIAAALSGGVSVVARLERFEESLVLPLLAMAGKTAVLVTVWAAATALEVALFPER